MPDLFRVNLVVPVSCTLSKVSPSASKPVTFILKPLPAFEELTSITGAALFINILPINVLVAVPFAVKEPAKVEAPSFAIDKCVVEVPLSAYLPKIKTPPSDLINLTLSSAVAPESFIINSA